MLFPIAKISNVITRVMFPSFSIIQNDDRRIREGYLKLLKYISLVTFPMMSGLFIVAPEFINVIYGAKWEPTVKILQIFCLVGAFQSIGTTVGTVQYAKGRPDIGFKWNCFAVFCISISLSIGVKWGIVGVAAAYAIISFILFPFIQSITNKLIGLKWKLFLSQFNNQIIGSLLIIISVLFFKILILSKFEVSQVIKLFCSVLMGFTVYIIYIFIKEKRSILEDIKSYSF
jgi:O-antigen/teichoic acid export membrane protein